MFILTIIVVGINTKEEYNFLLNRDFSHIMFQNILYLFLAYTFLFWEIEEWSWRFAYRKQLKKLRDHENDCRYGHLSREQLDETKRQLIKQEEGPLAILRKQGKLNPPDISLMSAQRQRKILVLGVLSDDIPLGDRAAEAVIGGLKWLIAKIPPIYNWVAGVFDPAWGWLHANIPAIYEGASDFAFNAAIWPALMLKVCQKLNDERCTEQKILVYLQGILLYENLDSPKYKKTYKTRAFRLRILNHQRDVARRKAAEQALQKTQQESKRKAHKQSQKNTK